MLSRFLKWELHLLSIIEPIHHTSQYNKKLYALVENVENQFRPWFAVYRAQYYSTLTGLL